MIAYAELLIVVNTHIRCIYINLHICVGDVNCYTYVYMSVNPWFVRFGSFQFGSVRFGSVRLACTAVQQTCLMRHVCVLSRSRHVCLCETEDMSTV